MAKIFGLKYLERAENIIGSFGGDETKRATYNMIAKTPDSKDDPISAL